MRLPDELVEELLDELQTAGEKHTQAKAAHFQAEQQRRITRAELMNVAKASGQKSFTAQEVYAHSSQLYKDAVDRVFQAILELGNAEYRCKLAEMRWESWRTINANQRAARV